VLAALGDVVDVVAWALREVSDRHARKLSHFAYASFHALLVSRAAREGVEVIEVNPAYTSVIGKIARLLLSPARAQTGAVRTGGGCPGGW